MKKRQLIIRYLKSVIWFIIAEIRRGTLRKNLKGISIMEFTEDMSWAELLEEKATKHPDKVYLTFEGKDYTFKDMDDNANRVANYMLAQGGSKGKGVSLFMENCVEFLDLFIGLQKIGMYSSLVSTHLRGSSLLHILNSTETEYLVIDAHLLEYYLKIANQVKYIKKVFVVNNAGLIPKEFLDFGEAYNESSEKPKTGYNNDDICFIAFTSGTTGLPKGVVYYYKNCGVKLYSLMATILYRRSDRFYTCLPLFHAGALWTIFSMSLSMGTRMVLAKRFSASRFWDDIIKYEITTFNSIGAILAILLKQPQSPNDSQNKVRVTSCVGCPADVWIEFEKRFGVKIFETYGATDNFGKSSFNFGTAPPGSIGKPASKTKYRIVDEFMKDVETGVAGHLIFEIGESIRGGYYKNPEATKEKFHDGYLFTGDLVKFDENGFLYYVGRLYDSIRVKGENVSAYEVEQEILKFPGVLECAVYAVKSDLIEDEIMVSINSDNSKKFDFKKLTEYLKENLPKYAVPRYFKLVNTFEKTGSNKIIKQPLKEQGVTEDTYDRITI